MSAIDSNYGALVANLPRDLRSAARDLPYLLGLTSQRGAGWADFVRLAPNRDLPFFAAEDPDEPERLVVSPAALEAFRAAHHCAGFHGLLVDRLADRQVETTAELELLAGRLAEQWQRSLAAATGNARLAERAIGGARLAWRRGVDLERQGLSRGQLPLAEYRRIVDLKLRWIGTAATCLLRAAGQQRRIAPFRTAHRLLLLSSQLMDDAQDSAEDERIHGTGIPAALGYPPGGLIRAAAPLARRAAAIAGRAGFRRLAAWLLLRASRLERSRSEGDPLQNELAGLIIAGALEG